MKKWILAALTLGLMACQQDSGGGGGGPSTPAAKTTVATPLSTTCLDGSSQCNGSIYARSPGFLPYQYRYGYQYNVSYYNNHGFCDCPTGYIPVYNNSYGLGCVQQRRLQPYSGFYLMWNWGQTGNNSWSYGTVDNGYAGINGSVSFSIGIGLNSGYNSYYGNSYRRGYYGPGQYHPYGTMNYQQVSNIPSAASCPRTLTQSCLLNQANTCGAGATCRQVFAGSSLGVCVSPTN